MTTASPSPKKKQRRLTKQRSTILTVLRKLNTHITADDLLKYVRQVMPSVNAATLYRNLHVLEETGDVASVSVGAKTFFEAVKVPHGHFWCRACQTLVAVPAKSIQLQTPESVELPEGYTVQHVSLVLEGLCPTCQTS